MTQLIEGARHLRIPLTSGLLLLLCGWLLLEGELPDSSILSAVDSLGPSGRIAITTVVATLIGHTVDDLLERFGYFRTFADPSLDGNFDLFPRRCQALAERVLNRDASDTVQKRIAERTLLRLDRIEGEFRFRVVLITHLPWVALVLWLKEEKASAAALLGATVLLAVQAIRLVRSPLTSDANLLSEIESKSASEAAIRATAARLGVLHLRIGSRLEKAVANLMAQIDGLSEYQRTSLTSKESFFLHEVIGKGTVSEEFFAIREMMQLHFDLGAQTEGD